MTTISHTNQELADLDPVQLECLLTTGSSESGPPTPGAGTSGALCDDCREAAQCKGTRRLRECSFCPSFVPAPPASGPSVKELEEQIHALSAKWPKLTADLRAALLTRRDVDFLSAERCPVGPGEVETARAAVAQARAALTAAATEVSQLTARLEIRRAQAARLDRWAAICTKKPAELHQLAEAREQWRAAGFVLAEAVEGELPSTRRLPFLQRLNDATQKLRLAAEVLKIRYPELARAGSPQLWDLTIPDAMN